MKKILFMLAAVLITAVAAYAQTEQRYMYVTKNDGSIVKAAVSDVQDITFSKDNIPVSATEAINMFYGKWNCKFTDAYGTLIDRSYEFSYDASSERPYKLVVEETLYYKDENGEDVVSGPYDTNVASAAPYVHPNTDNPTEGNLYYPGGGWGDYITEQYKDLTQDSFILLTARGTDDGTPVERTFVRVVE